MSSTVDRRKGQCRGPEAGNRLAYVKHSKGATALGAAERARRKRIRRRGQRGHEDPGEWASQATRRSLRSAVIKRMTSAYELRIGRQGQ